MPIIVCELLEITRIEPGVKHSGSIHSPSTVVVGALHQLVGQLPFMREREWAERQAKYAMPKIR